jgi:hypothetical protein
MKNDPSFPTDVAPLVPVRFEFTHPTAATVCVAGTFNDWQPETKILRPISSCHWVEEAALLPGIYEYCLVVDGQWMPDPLATDQVPNPFGGVNSILRVPGAPANSDSPGIHPISKTLKKSSSKKKILRTTTAERV